MAYVVVNSKYNPFTFDELIKPYTMYEDAYEKQEAVLDAAREKEFTDYLDQQLDPEAYNMYNTASTGLKAVSDELATRGLSPELRGRIKSVARDYKSTMDTLNTAQTKLNAEMERRLKNGSDYVYQQNDLRIGDFLGGRTPNQKGESLTDITKDISTEFAHRAAQITEDTWSKAMDSNGKVVGGYYDLATTTGLSAAQLDTILSDSSTWESIMRDPRISDSQKNQLRSFRNVIETKKRAIDYDKYDGDSRNKIDEAIAVGAHAGLGTTKHDYQVDRGYNPLGWAQFNYQRDKWLAEFKAKYPQYQVNEKTGALVTDENGSPKLNKGWSYDDKGNLLKDGKMIQPTSKSSTRQTNPQQGKTPFFGTYLVTKDGKSRPMTSAQVSNDSYSGFPLTSDGTSIGYYTTRKNKTTKEKETIIEPLNSTQLGYLADLVNEPRGQNPQIIFEQLQSRGIVVTILNNGQMVVQSTRPTNMISGESNNIENKSEDEDIEFNPDA